MKVLVTGAGGFIPSHLVEALLRDKHDVRALIHYNALGSWGHLSHLAENTPANLDVRLGDVTDPFLMRDMIAGCDVVFHLAALIGIPYSYVAPASYVATNIHGTLNVLEACRHANVKRVIVTSTSEVYGTARYAPIDEAHPLQGQSPYSASKIAADKLAEAFFCSFDLPVVVLRPFNTYGPRQSTRAIIPTVLTQALAGAKEIQIGSLAPQRDLTFVSDTVDAFLLAAEAKNVEGQVIHFGQGKAITIGELAQRCLDIAGSNARLVSVDARVRPEKSEVGLLLCNPAKARELLGWQPRVDLDNGLRQTCAWLKNNLERYHIGRYMV